VEGWLTLGIDEAPVAISEVALEQSPRPQTDELVTSENGQNLAAG